MALVLVSFGEIKTLGAPRVRISLAPPPSPYRWGTRSQLSEIARVCAVICSSYGTGESAFGAVRRQQAGNFSDGNLGGSVWVL